MPISTCRSILSRRRKSVNRAIRPTVDGLEDRMLLYATTGASWAFPQRITYSLVPDGTVLSTGATTSTSNLFATMNAKFPGVNWQGQIQRAAAVWSMATNINLVQVSDNGTALGGGNYQQGDPNMGDIRIGGSTVDLSSSQLAECFLLSPTGGSSIDGDILVNDNQNWQINSGIDLQTVMIHEIGHALGLDHSAVSTADMYPTYNNVKQILTTDDSSGVQSVYSGVRKADAYEGPAPGNYNSTTATNIDAFLNNSTNQVMLPQTNTGAYPDINSSLDQDWYKVTVPTPAAGTTLSGLMMVQMTSANLSSLSPRVQVYNGSSQSLAIATAPSVYGAQVCVTINNVSPGQVYFFRATAANNGVTGSGAYALNVNFGTAAASATPIPVTTVYAQPNPAPLSSAQGSADILTIDLDGIAVGIANPAPRLAPPVHLYASSDTSVSSSSSANVNFSTTGLMAFNSNGSVSLNTFDQALSSVSANTITTKKVALSV